MSIRSTLPLYALLACTPAAESTPGEASSTFQAGGDASFTTPLGRGRAHLSASGLRTSPDGLRLQLTRWGREGELRVVEEKEPSFGDCSVLSSVSDCDRRVEVQHPGMKEYWQGSREGLEQGWKLTERPSGEGLLVMEVSFHNAETWRVRDGKRVELTDMTGASWSYDKLVAWDAKGRQLSAWMEATTQGVRLAVEDGDAVYPLTIDPTLSPGASFTANGTSVQFGDAVSPAGDVNGDGFEDVIVGSGGAAYIYLGGVAGLDLSSEVKVELNTGTANNFGRNVAGGGDLNGDGYDDVVVTNYSTGRLHIYYGSPSGIDVDTLTIHAGPSGYQINFGQAIDSAGDVNGDGYDDVIVGAPGGVAGGYAHLFYGSATGLNLTPLVIDSDTRAAWDYYGGAVAGVGDVNGDGFDDVLVGSTGGGYGGQGFLYYGSAAGLNISQTLIALNLVDNSKFGKAVGGAGDVNGDGYDDIVVGAWGQASPGWAVGVSYVYFGSASGIETTENRLDPISVYAEYGRVVAGVGDVNNDGYDDMLIGAPLANQAFLHVGLCDNPTLYFADADADGYGDPNATLSSCSPVSGFVTNTDDCDDTSALAYNGAAEVCDGVDNDCDGVVDAGAPGETAWFSDGDGDGFGDPLQVVMACFAPANYVDNADDCNDGEPLAWTGAPELCDGVDNDCQNAVDVDAIDQPTWYGDLDGDGFGDPNNVALACTAPVYFVDNGNDCDDTTDLAYTGAVEHCDGIDNDCDGTTDVNAVESQPWFQDLDGDGRGAPQSVIFTCSAPPGHVANPDDCNDFEPLAYDNAMEVCDGVDNDCNGTIDPPGSLGGNPYLIDADGDGEGDASRIPVLACSLPSGYADNNLDCDDADADVNSTADELCDGIDNNCDGDVDNDATDAIVYYEDRDGDGYGDILRPLPLCSLPAGYVADSTDCDDSVSTVYPGANEVLGDGIDQNCDGVDGTAPPVTPPPATVPPVTPPPATVPPSPTGAEDSGGCSTSGAPSGWFALAGVLLFARRRSL